MSLQSRQSRASKVIHHVRVLEAARQIIRLRKNAHALEREFDGGEIVSVLPDGSKIPGPALAVLDRILKVYDRILTIAGWPKPGPWKGNAAMPEQFAMRQASRATVELAQELESTPTSGQMDSNPAPHNSE